MIAGYPGHFVDGWSNLCNANSMTDKSYGHIPLKLNYLLLCE